MSFISNINAEIKNIVENEEDLSFSSNSEQESTNKKSDIEYLLDPKDEDMRDEHLHNISSSESNITPLNSLGNNENSENEMHSDKIQIKKEKNENNELNDKKIQNKFNLNEQGLNDIIKNNNADNYNIISPNILMDDSNFANTINFKNINSDSKFIYPFDSMIEI